VCVEQVSGGAGTAAADGADDGTSNLYDTSTWQVVSTLAGHAGAVYALCWLEGAAGGGGGGAGALLTGGFDGAMKLWWDPYWPFRSVSFRFVSFRRRSSGTLSCVHMARHFI